MTGTVETVCPSCGTTSSIDSTARTADQFCPSCDYPLFWAVDGDWDRADVSEGLRRLPGMAGLQTVGSLVCPSCAERNPSTNERCIRCTGILRPVRVVEVEEAVVAPAPIIRPPIGSMAPIYLWLLVVPTIVLLVLLALQG